jgi:hypothetical protein
MYGDFQKENGTLLPDFFGNVAGHPTVYESKTN